MSWKGFKKAINRLPAQITTTFSKAGVTIDSETEYLRSELKHMDKSLKDLHKKASSFHNSFLGIYTYQANFINVLLDSLDNVDSGAMGRGPEYSNTNEKIYSDLKNLASLYQNQLQAHSDRLFDQMDMFDSNVISRITELLNIVKAMTAVLSKRDNKLLDYDRHRSTVQKYEERGNKPGGRSLPDEQAYQKSLDQFREATRQYKYYNSMIKDDVKNFLEYKNQYMALLRERITLAQRSMIMELHKVLQGSTGGMRQFNLNADVIEEWKAAWKPADSMLSELDIWGSGVMQTGKYNPNRGDLSSKILKPFSRDPTPRMYSPRKSETPSSEQKTYSHSPPPYHEAGSSSSNINQNAAQNSYQYNGAATKPSTHFSTNSLSSSGYNSAAAVQQMSMPKPPPPPIPKSQPKTVYAVALYEFAGQQEGDLVIKPNDVIEIIERTPEVNDWWTGRLRGKIGTFPGTYVRIMDN